MKIDFDGLDQRIVALPVDRANWVALEAGAEGIVFLLQAPTALAAEDYLEFGDENPPPVDVHRFDLKARKAEKFVEKIDGGSGVYGGQPPFLVSFDGTKALYRQKKGWFLVSSEKAPKAGDGALKVEGLEVWVDPRAEWRQMYRETWRIQRDFLYDPGAHGLDLAAAEKLYAPFVDGLGGRDDLNRLFEEMLGHLVLGHVFVGGGAVPEQEKVSVGLLGADYAVAEGRYRISRILAGENWNPKLKAPLTQPGVDVKEGDFLLAVNGQELKGDDDVHRLFLGTAGKQTVLTVGAKADGTGSRRVTVVPAPSEGGLRLRTWMEENRKKVDALSGGKVGYVFIPDTAAGGFTNFNRYYFSEIGKEALVLDERFNHGGSIADYIVDLLARTPTMANASREGEDVVDPAQTVFGPKVMLDQPDVGLRGRRAAVALPEGEARPDRRQEDVGRPRRHRRLPRADRRRFGHRAPLGPLRDGGRVGGGERRHRARRRGRGGPGPRPPGEGAAARARRPARARGAREEPAREAEEADVPGLRAAAAEEGAVTARGVEA